MSVPSLKASIEASLHAGESFGSSDGDTETVTIPADVLRDILLAQPNPSTNPGQLWIRNARISGSLDLDGCKIDRSLRVESCVFEESIHLDQAELPDASFVDCTIPAGIVANQLTTRWNLILQDSEIEQGVSLAGSRFGGVVSLKGAVVRGDLNDTDDCIALNLTSAEIGHVLNCDLLTATGEITALGAAIGQATFRHATLGGHDEAPNRTKALSADGSRIANGLFCAAMEAEGEIRLHGAKIGGQVSLPGATLTGREDAQGTITAISADGVDIGHDLVCNQLKAQGDIRLLGAKIGGQLSLPGATLEGKKGRGFPGVTAISADRIVVAESMFLDQSKIDGEVSMPGAKIEGQVSLRDAVLNASGETGQALDLCGASVGEIAMASSVISGTVDLRQATVRSLWDAANGRFPARRASMRLQDFAYGSLREPLDAERRLEWIEASQGSSYFPGVYVELANAFHRIGHRSDARRVAIAGERKAIDQLNRWRPRWLWNKLLWVTAGSGYRNWLAIVWLLGLLAVGSFFFHGYEDDFIRIVRTPPPFNPILYAVDATIPVLDVGQQRAWAATGWLRWLSLGLTIAGYALVTAVIAAATGLLNRDQRA